MWHDLGKYADQFQRRLLTPFAEKGKDHSTAGAATVLGCYKHCGEIAALSIDGHHIGLQQIKRANIWLSEICQNIKNKERCCLLTETNFRLLIERYKEDGLPFPPISKGVSHSTLHDEKSAAAAMLDVRMLFSALTDADFLNTEAHFSGSPECPVKYRPEGPLLDPDACIRRLNEYMDSLRSENKSSDQIQSIRDTLFRCCQEEARNDQGIFTLSAPTGAGKTLSMLAFALYHAQKHHIRRIILVMPYLNIIEQTHKVYRKLFNEAHGFPDNYILEDHSLAHQNDDDEAADHENESQKTQRLLAENWDAPIILTTSVKCLESLMANRSSSCRKLHRLAGSIILFDEVQTLPPKLIVLTLATLSRLADPKGPYRSSIVFSTATQPAFDHLHSRVSELNPSGWIPKEVVSEKQHLFASAANRVDVHWRQDQPITKEDLINEISKYDQILCIFNLKRHAKEIAEKLKEKGTNEVCHLSTNMCPAHRKSVLEKVHNYLDPENPKPICLISTQCVEAGVDLDFPVVYRALAPLESLAQAAGRCNRNGIRPEKGKVVIFRLASDGRCEFPPGYKEGVDTTGIYLNTLKHNNQLLDTLEIFNNPELFRRYYQQFYDLTGRIKGERRDEKELLIAVEAGDFVRTAQHYKLIDQDSINVVTPYDRTVFDDLIEEMESDGYRDIEFIRQWIAKARPYTVSMVRPMPDKAVWNCLKPIQFSRKKEANNHNSNWFKTLEAVKYDELTGLEIPEDSWIG